MSTLNYFNYEGVGKTNNKLYSYSQAVRVGNIIKCSGQGGWDAEGNIDKDDLKGQIDLAFKNEFRKWMPGHQPTWTCVGVTELGIPGMIVEIEVEAYVS
ncbi:hypothetical protein CEP52_012413 [Fusarium oligoseptatum]|uniref:Uncharacterized protein n=1 Tax=Fusarium oligoseptatum TaxID=2604345 RepID=A0A428SYE9_9HYPO|nr:hypothetical protein CEP52_012413 [Fusarium oligoseptatum]